MIWRTFFKGFWVKSYTVYCYGIQGPTVLFMYYNQNLHNLQNDAETTTTDYAKVQILYWAEFRHISTHPNAHYFYEHFCK